MFRRKVVQLMTFAGAEGLRTIAPRDIGNSRILTYRVKGLSCITCALGLDTMLQQQRGVVWSRANYTEGSVVIRFYPREVTEASLRALTEGMSFSIEEMDIRWNFTGSTKAL